MGELPGSALAVSVSNQNDVRSNVEQWLFARAPQNLSELIADHTPGTEFRPVVIRPVVPFTMQNAANVFAAMTEDSNIEQKTLRIKDQQMSLVDKSIVIRLSRELVDPSPPDEQTHIGAKRSPLSRFKQFIRPSHPFIPEGVQYATLTAIMIRYRPLCTLYHTIGRMEIKLIDDALAGDIPVAFTSSSRTAPANILMGVNHSIPVYQLSRLQLKIDVNNTGMKPGFPWGTMEFAFCFQFSSKALVSGFTNSMVQYELPSDLFIIRSRDPTQFNAELQQSDIDAMREIEADIPVLERRQLSNIGKLVRKAKADGDDYPPGNPFDDKYEASSFDPRNPHGLPSTPSSFSIGSSLIRPLTSTLEMATAKVAELEAAVERRRAMEKAISMMENVPGVFGLPGVLRQLLACPIPDTWSTRGEVSREVLGLVCSLPESSSLVYIHKRDDNKTIRIGLQPFAGAIAVTLFEALFTGDGYIFTAA